MLALAMAREAPWTRTSATWAPHHQDRRRRTADPGSDQPPPAAGYEDAGHPPGSGKVKLVDMRCIRGKTAFWAQFAGYELTGLTRRLPALIESTSSNRGPAGR